MPAPTSTLERAASAYADAVPESAIHYYGVGTGYLGISVLPGADGTIYFSLATSVTNPLSGVIGRLNPQTMTVRSINAGSLSLDVQTPDGALWGSANEYGPQAVVRIAPFSTQGVTAIPLPPATGATPLPAGMAYDAADRNVYVADFQGHRVGKIPAAGPYRTSSFTMYAVPSGPSNTPGLPAAPSGLTAAPNGNVFFADTANGMVYKLDASGQLTGYITPAQMIDKCTAIDTVAAPDDSRVFVAGWRFEDGCNSSNYQGVLYSMTQSGSFAPLALPMDAYNDPYLTNSAGGIVTFAAPDINSIGVFSPVTGKLEVLPTQTMGFGPNKPREAVAASPSSVWFSPVGFTRNQTGPLSLGNLVLTSKWGIFPGTTIDLPSGSFPQLIGIGETGDSGPFSVVSSNPSLIQVKLAPNLDHDFVITRGKANGTAIVSVSDAHGRTVDVVVKAMK
jgi:streptogramin lyase